MEKMMIRGYARVSTTDQHFDGQIAQLKKAGATRVYREKVSGATRERPQLRKRLRELEAGDVVLVTRLDRLESGTAPNHALTWRSLRVAIRGAPPMTTNIDTRDVCCVALELSKTSWVCAFAAPYGNKVSFGSSARTSAKACAGDLTR
jgi:hypothetical protein